LLRLVASVCGGRCQNVAKTLPKLTEKTATSERWGWQTCDYGARRSRWLWCPSKGGFPVPPP